MSTRCQLMSLQRQIPKDMRITLGCWFFQRMIPSLSLPCCTFFGALFERGTYLSNFVLGELWGFWCQQFWAGQIDPMMSQYSVIILDEECIIFFQSNTSLECSRLKRMTALESSTDAHFFGVAFCILCLANLVLPFKQYIYLQTLERLTMKRGATRPICSWSCFGRRNNVTTEIKEPLNQEYKNATTSAV